MAEHETIGTRLVHDAGRASRRLTRYRLTELAGEKRSEEVSAPTYRIGSRDGNDLRIADSTVSRFHLEIVATPAGFLARDLGSTNGTWIDGLRVVEAYLRPGCCASGPRTCFRDPDGRAAVTSAHDSAVERAVRASVQHPQARLLGRDHLVEGRRHGQGSSPGRTAGTRDQPTRSSTTRRSGNLFERCYGHEGARSPAPTPARGRRRPAAARRLGKISELRSTQPKLLRVLERREVRRVGGTTTQKVDVRVVAATNRDLAREVNRGAFREDLYYRLAVIRVVLPPLRDRPEDILLLVERFVKDTLSKDSARADQVLTGISEENWQRLLKHPWPGNVRELRNFIERTVALSRPGAPLSTDAFPAAAPGASSPPPALGTLPAVTPSGDAPLGKVDIDRPFIDGKAEALAAFEKAYLTSILDRHAGNIQRRRRRGPRPDVLQAAVEEVPG
jgi:hypothetical protein